MDLGHDEEIGAAFEQYDRLVRWEEHNSRLDATDPVHERAMQRGRIVALIANLAATATKQRYTSAEKVPGYDDVIDHVAFLDREAFDRAILDLANGSAPVAKASEEPTYVGGVMGADEMTPGPSQDELDDLWGAYGDAYVEWHEAFLEEPMGSGASFDVMGAKRDAVEAAIRAPLDLKLREIKRLVDGALDEG